MAKVMWICGILLVAAGIATGVLLFASAQRPEVLTIDTAAILLVGGVLAAGLGGVVDALRRPGAAALSPAASVETPAEAETPAAPIPEFGPRGAKAAAATVTAVAVVEETVVEDVAEEVSRPTRETIQALEQARQKIEQAFDARKSAPPPEAVAEDVPATAPQPEAEAEAEEPDDIVEEAVAEEEVVDDGQLYVVEERVIRRHPARILSDGTVEAETAEGWMRFENLEHLDEYLDAMEPARG